MTYGEAISRVVNSLNSISKDVRVPKRLVLNILKTVGEFLVSQKMRDKTLYRETNTFKWLHCVELEPDDVVKCPIVEFRRCDSIMKSKKPLPKIVSSRYGEAILKVVSIDGNNEYKPTLLTTYNNSKKIRNANKFKGGKYYIKDRYLYLPDTEVEVVDMLVLTLDEDYEEACGCKEDMECKSVWDTELPLPDKLANVVIAETIKEVGMRLSVPTEENPNLDSNQKTQTVQ